MTHQTNNTTHTPGPWGVAIGLTEYETVCTMCPSPSWEPKRIDAAREILSDEVEHNARLIAAAPELLNSALLQGMIHPKTPAEHKRFNKFAKSLGWNPQQQTFGAFADEYRRAAIAKAQGGAR